MDTLTRPRPRLHDKLPTSAACPPKGELLSRDSRLSPYTCSPGVTSPSRDSQNTISESKQSKKRKCKKMEGLSHEEAEIKRLRANEQERDRQRQMTDALEALRRCNMPYNPNICNKEDSKVYVIKTATDYIRALAQMIRDYDRGILPESSGVVSPSYPGYTAQTPGYPAYISPRGVGYSTPHVGLYPGDDLCSKPHTGLGRVGHTPDTTLGYSSPVLFDMVEQHQPQHQPQHHTQPSTTCLPHSINHDHFLHADHFNYSYVQPTATMGQPELSWPLPAAQTAETKTLLMIPQQCTHYVLDQRTPYKSSPSPLDVNPLQSRPPAPLLHSTPVDSNSTLLPRRELTNSKSVGQQKDVGVGQTTPHMAPNDSRNYRTPNDSGNYRTPNDSGNFRTSNDSGNFRTSNDSGNYRTSNDSGNYRTTDDSGNCRTSNDSGNYRTTDDSGNCRTSNDSGNFRTTDDSGNFTMNSGSSSSHFSTDLRSNPTDTYMFSPERISRTVDEIFGASFLAPSPVQRLNFDSV